MRNRDRILVLEKVDPKADIGLFDPEVFKGKNNLHLIRDDSCMWKFKMERGHVAPPLQSRYTDFNTALKQAEVYLNTKNIRIKEIID